jgi:predicted DNA-binding protein
MAEQEKDSVYKIRLPEELKKSFLKVARATDRSGAQLVRDFMRRYTREHEDRLQQKLPFRPEKPAETP